MVPGTRPSLDLYGRSGQTTLKFQIAADGIVSGSTNPVAAQSSGTTITFANVVVECDPTTFTGTYRLYGDFFGGKVRTIVVPGLPLPVTVTDTIGGSVFVSPDAVTPSFLDLVVSGQTHRFNFRPVSAPFSVNINPGSYAGDYTVLGTNQTRPTTLSLMPGLYHFDNGSGGRFTFEVNAVGHVANIQTPSAAHAVGDTLFLHNSELVIDPQSFTGKLWLLGQNPHQMKPGLQSFTVVPGMAYQVDLGGNDRIGFQIAAIGDVTAINNPAAARGVANRLILNNTVLNVEPQSYTGSYFPGSHLNLPSFSGAQSIVLVPNMRYNLSIGDLYSNFWFRLDESGQVTNIENPAAAHASGRTLVLKNVGVVFDPQAYAGYYYPHTHSFRDFRGRRETIVLVPNLTYPVSIGDLHSHFSFTIDGAGQITNIANPAAAFVRDNALTLRNTCVRVNPGGYADNYEMILVGAGRGEKTFTLVPSIRYYFRDSANQARPFTLDDEGQPTPTSLAVSLDGQSYDFTLAALACDQTPPSTTASLSSTPNGAGWNNSNVTLSLAASDGEGGTGVREITYSASGAQVLPQTTAPGASATLAMTAEGVTTVAFYATDNAGHREESKTFTIKIDKSAPTVTCAPADGSWHADNVLLPCTASDALSTLADGADASFSLTTSVPAGAETANALTGSRQVCDLAGNCFAAGPVTGNKVDRKAPEIMLASPAQGSSYSLGQAVAAGYTCSDGGSGVSNCAGTVASGSPLNTASIGVQTFAVQATDAAGNTANASAVYTVGYGVCPQFDQTKAHKSGSTIPIKLQLCDANGNNLSSPNIAVTALGTLKLSDYAPGEVEDAGNSNPDDNFRLTGDIYHFNLKTTGLPTGTYVLVFRAGNDALTRSVQFQIK